MLILFEPTLSSSIMPVIPADAFSLPYHKYITDEALSFLKQPILGEIFKGSLHSDTIHQFFSPEYHFDDCKFQESSQHINSLYENLPYNMDPKTFGKILHAAADFYSHSNWIEMGKSDLIDKERYEWTVLPKMKLLEKHGVFVIQGEEKDIPAGYDLSRAPGKKVVKVTAPDGKEYPGLITGTAYLTDDCPDKYRGQDIAISHFDSFAGGKGQGLNKDKPGIDGFEKAVDLAIAQTQHEWCRLVNLVEREQGAEGKQKLFDLWVADKTTAEQTACPPPELKVSIVSGASSLTDTAFQPNPLQVSVGSTVTWTNDDIVQPFPEDYESYSKLYHTVTSGADPNFDSGIMAPGALFYFTFTKAGEYPYYCILHPNMVGTVIVSEYDGTIS